MRRLSTYTGLCFLKQIRSHRILRHIFFAANLRKTIIGIILVYFLFIFFTQYQEILYMEITTTTLHFTSQK